MKLRQQTQPWWTKKWLEPKVHVIKNKGSGSLYQKHTRLTSALLWPAHTFRPPPMSQKLDRRPHDQPPMDALTINNAALLLPHHSYTHLMLRLKLDCQPDDWPPMDIGHLLDKQLSTMQPAWLVDHKLKQPAPAPAPSTCCILLRCFAFDFFTKCFWCGPCGSFRRIQWFVCVPIDWYFSNDFWTLLLHCHW